MPLFRWSLFVRHQYGQQTQLNRPQFRGRFPGRCQCGRCGSARRCRVPPSLFHSARWKPQLHETNFVNGSSCRTAHRFQMSWVFEQHSRLPTGLRTPGNTAITEPTCLVSRDVMRPAVPRVAAELFLSQAGFFVENRGKIVRDYGKLRWLQLICLMTG